MRAIVCQHFAGSGRRHLLLLLLLLLLLRGRRRRPLLLPRAAGRAAAFRRRRTPRRSACVRCRRTRWTRGAPADLKASDAADRADCGVLLPSLPACERGVEDPGLVLKVLSSFFMQGAGASAGARGRRRHGLVRRASHPPSAQSASRWHVPCCSSSTRRPFRDVSPTSRPHHGLLSTNRAVFVRGKEPVAYRHKGHSLAGRRVGESAGACVGRARASRHGQRCRD